MLRVAIVVVAMSVAAGCAEDGEPGGPGDAAPADAAVAPDADTRCAACEPGELCVQTFDGVCGELSVRCVTATAGCPAAACSEACDDEVCNAGGGEPRFTCSSGGCQGELAGALRCYGP